jgi:hypothetical protein
MSTKRLFAGVTVITCAVMMLGGSFAPARAMTLEELEAAIAALQAELLEAQAQLDELEGEDGTATPVAYEGIPDGFTFDNTLYQGMSGDEVKYLQIILNADATVADQVAATSWGSPGNETIYFGPLTHAAAIKFQERYADDVLDYWGLTSGTGYVGETTTAKLNELLSAVVEPEPEPGDYDNEADCTDADFHWWDDECHSAAKGASDYDNEDDCVDADFYWYDDACNTTEEGEEEPVTDRGIELSDDNPAAATLMSGSAYNEMLKFDASAGTDDWDITSITVERFGISIDSMVDGILIQDEDGARHGNVYTFSEKVATIVFDSNPISIPAGETQEIAVLFNLGSTATSGTLGAKVTAMTSDPDGLSLVSNTFSLALGTSVLGGMQVDVVNVSNALVTVDLEIEDQIVTKFKFTENTSNEDVYLEELTVYNNGNAVDADLANWELRDPSNNTLATVEQSDGKYVVFDLTGSPGYKIPKGSSRTLSLYVDVVSGASRTTQAAIMNDYDVKAIGKDTGTRILATADATSGTDKSFPIGDIAVNTAGYNTMQAAAGSLTATPASDMPTGTVPAGGSDVVFAKFDLKAKGEDMEVRQIDFYLKERIAPDNDGDGTANNANDIFTGTVSLKTSDGVSRKSLTVADDVPDNAEHTYTLASYFTIPAGTTETISIVGNLRTDLSSTDYFKWAIQDVYVKRLTTNDYDTQATNELLANRLTGSTGSLTAVKDAGWGSKSIIAGSAKQIGQYVLQTGSAEGVYISTLDVDMSGTGVITTVNELWLQKGVGVCDENSDDVIGSIDTSVSGSNDSFSTGGKLEIPASSAQTIIVCANFNKSTATGTYITGFGSGDIDGTGVTSGESVTTTAAAGGQTMTVQSSGILTIKNGSNPNAAVLHASESGVKLMDMTIGTLYEPITIDTFRFTVEDDADQDRNFSNYTLKDGSDTVSSGKSAVSGVITFSGLSETIPYYGSESYSLWVDTSDALTMGSADKARVKLASVEAIGDWSNTEILESDEDGYMGTVTTEPGSASSVGHYKAGDLVVSIDNFELRPVIADTNEAVSLTGTGLDLGAATNETFTATEEVSKFGSIAQAANITTAIATTTTGIAVNDYVVLHDASADEVYAGLVTATVATTSITVADVTGSQAITLTTGDINVELTGSNVALTGALPLVGDLVGVYDDDEGMTYTGIVTTMTDNASGGTFSTLDTIVVNATSTTVAADDSYFAFDFDTSQEEYSAASTYQYSVGDVVYHYDNSATTTTPTGGWAVVTTGIKAGETMANLITSLATAAANDRIVRVSPVVVGSNIMNMHDVEPVLTASDTTYSTGIAGSMQTIAIYDVTAVGGSLKVKSLALTLEGSGAGQLAATANAWEIWESGERIYRGGTLSGAATYTCAFTSAEEILAGATKTFTVKLNTAGTWAAAQVGMSLSAKINGIKGQDGSGLSWYYSSAGPGTAPTNAIPATITDSELPVYGKYSLTY